MAERLVAHIPEKTGGLLPFLRPSPAKLSGLLSELQKIEASGVFSNFGPVNSRFERAATDRLFDGIGGCITACNATLGLILAIKEAADQVPAAPERRFALMPSFTHAATAHAAIWAGLTPLFYDIEPDTWLPCGRAEEELLSKHDREIAVLVPYATFGNCLDLRRYEAIAREYRIGLVVDAAASLGCQDFQGRAFGAGFPYALVYSMHVTKPFSTSEGGLIHCGDQERLARLRTMSNFGFGQSRSATSTGINSKLSEIGALLALSKLDEFEAVIARRAMLERAYRRLLPQGWRTQQLTGERCVYQFMPVALPECGAARQAALSRLQASQIGAAHYFSPHLAEQPFFARSCVSASLEVTRRIADRIISLPMSDYMSEDDVVRVCSVLSSIGPAE